LKFRGIISDYPQEVSVHEHQMSEWQTSVERQRNERSQDCDWTLESQRIQGEP
jgi:hypothetical protein